MRTPAEISKEINELDDRLWISSSDAEVAELIAKLKTLNNEYDALIALMLFSVQEKTR